jgi:hypothetical protein
MELGEKSKQMVDEMKLVAQLGPTPNSIYDGVKQWRTTILRLQTAAQFTTAL